MIYTADLIYEIDQKLNKLSGLDHQSIQIEDKLIALNNGQIKIVKKKLNPQNVLGVGFDGNKKRYEDLEFLVEPANKHVIEGDDPQKGLILTDPFLNKWSSDLSTLTPNYMFFVDGYLIANKGNCKGRIIYLNSHLIKHGSVTTLLNNPSWVPSFEYQEAFCTLSSKRIEVFTDGTFTPTQLYLSYIRYPVQMDYEGYVNSQGEDSNIVNCELPYYMKEELLDATVLELGIETENPTIAQVAQLRQANDE